MIRSAGAAVVCGSFLLSVPAAAGQAHQGDVPRFRVSVDAVRIDAVVTDKDGRTVRDLTVDDFVVLQNGKPQTVTFAQFVPVSSSGGSSATPPAAMTSRRPADAPPAASVLIAPRSTIQRTLVIVVDDLGLSVESLYQAKRALHEFIDRDVRATDLVGVLRTGGSIGSLQPFTTDRRILHQLIDGLRWNGSSRAGVESFEPLNQWTTFDAPFPAARPDDHADGGAIADERLRPDPNDFAQLNAVRRSIMASGSLGALNLAIRAARDLPGRKALVFVSEGFQLEIEDSRVREAVDAVIDQATRAGVVIYCLDPRGLQTAGLQASDNLKRPDPGMTMEETARDHGRRRLLFNRDTQEALAYVAEQTGGFAVLNTNDLGNGLGRISADVRDYYIIGYEPEEGTFAAKGKKPSYHNVAVKVRRPGVRVRTRKQFLGVSDAEEQDGPLTPAQELIRAAISPFTSTEIPLLATPLPGWSPDRGLFVRTLLHVDARALTFADGADGKRTAAADVLGMVFDGHGTQVAHLTTGFEVGLTDAATEDGLQRGLAYTLLVPILRPGGYQLRFAIRDRESGRLGSAGEFVEMPDVQRGQFALSGIVLRAEDDSPGSRAPAGMSVTPEQALRVYPARTPLAYALDIYNAAQRVEIAITVWRGEQRIASLPTRTLMVPAGSGARLTAAGGLKLGESLPPGHYILHLAAATADPKRAGLARTAAQFIQFEVR